MKKLFVFAGFCALTTGLTASTLFVDKVTGDDAAAAADARRLVNFRTIQAALDCAEAGDVVRVYPGVYDEGGFVDSNGLTNRVCITKGLTLEATSSNPADTVILGAWDPSNAQIGVGPAAVRCVLATAEEGTVIVRGFTLKNGATLPGGVGGGFCGSDRNRFYLVDSVLLGCSGGADVNGSGFLSATAVRCRILGTWGGYSVHNARLVHSLVAGSHGTEANSTAAVENSEVYNSTIVDSNRYGFRGSTHVYNSVVMLTGKGVTSGSSDTSLSAAYSVAAPWVNTRYTPGDDCVLQTDEMPFLSPASGDYRPLSGSVLLNVGKAELLGDLELPDGIDPYVDLAGDAVPKTGSITAGAYQQPVDAEAASGEIVVNGRLSVGGYRTGLSGLILRTANGPAPVRLDCPLSVGQELVCISLPGVLGGALYPQMDGTVWTMTPPNGERLTCTPIVTSEIYHVDPDPDRGNDGNVGTADAPFLSIQAAVSRATGQGTVIHCAPGVYTNGSSEVQHSRVNIDQPYVRIVGAGRDRSFLYGRKATGTEDVEDGRGNDALRCVRAAAAGCLQGFTVANGYTFAGTTSASDYKGGLITTSGGGNTDFQVQDCTLGNGWAARGSIALGGVFRRCLITGQTNALESVSQHFRTSSAFVSCIYAGNDASPDQTFYLDGGDGGIYQSTILHQGDAGPFTSVKAVRNSLVGSAKKVSVADAAGSLRVNDFTWSGVALDVTALRGSVWGDYRIGASSSAVSCGETPSYVWYTTDFDGKPFIPDADGHVCAGALTTTVAGGQIYVDGGNGDDSNSGLSSDVPVRTLPAAMSHAKTAAAVTVHLASGTYGAAGGTFVDQWNTPYRLIVPSGVTVVGDAGAEQTVLDAEGCAETPICGAFADGILKGVTVTGGYYEGNAGCSGSGIFVDCIISNNYCGDAGSSGSACTSASLYGCLVDHNRGKFTGYNVGWIENCTFGPDNKNKNGTGDSNITRGTTRGIINSIVMTSNCQTKDTTLLTSSIFTCGQPAGVPSDSLFGVDPAAIAIGGDYRLDGESIAVDYCATAPDDLLGGLDAVGGQRVYNGRLDAGAVEYDSRGDFGKTLGKCTVVAADPAVTNAADGLVIAGDGALKVRIENSTGEVQTVRIPVRIVGSGVLTVTLNGKVVATFSTGDVRYCKIKNAQAANDVVLSYAAGDGQMGHAEVGSFLGAPGFGLIVR